MHKTAVFGPLIGQLVLATLFYVVAPMLMLVLPWFSISIKPKYEHLDSLFALIAILLYLFYVASSLAPGIQAVLDCTTNSFITKSVTYIETLDPGHRAQGVVPTRKAPKKTSPSMSIDYLKVIFEGHEGKSSYVATHYHNMVANEKYTVTYGRFSRLLLSVTDADGVEMLQFR